VERNTATIRRAISEAQREIELIREHRSRLIADVVTGKLDVREASASLPDEADEPDEVLANETLLKSADDAELASDELDEDVVA
jgi:type I restriction enzyme, S subunit